MLVAVGDRVSEGTPIAVIQPGEGALRQPPSLMGQMEPDPVAVEPEPLPAAAAVGAAVPATPPAAEGAVGR